jgi:hypothetical protein
MKKLVKSLVMGLILSPLLCFSFEAHLVDVQTAFDMQTETLPKNFKVFVPSIAVDLSYDLLEDTKASSSGQFSEKTFVTLLEELSSCSEKLVIVDLRAESHGFVNGQSVCWRNRFNDRDPTSEEVEEEENVGLAQALSEGYLFVDQLELQVFRAITERALVEDAGHTYVRLPLMNAHRPSEQFTDQFVQFIKSLSPDEWVHFHSEVDKTKTRLLMILMHIIKNGDQISFEDILWRQQILNEEFAQEEEFKQTEQERLTFLHEFYTYMQQFPNCDILWSEWIQQQHINDEETATTNTDKTSFASNNSIAASNQTTGPLKINRAIYNLFRVPVLLTKRHHSGREPGGHDREGWSGKVGGKCKWGSENGPSWSVYVQGEAHDGKGNYIEGKISQSSNGHGQADIHGGHESK